MEALIKVTMSTIKELYELEVVIASKLVDKDKIAEKKEEVQAYILHDNDSNHKDKFEDLHRVMNDIDLSKAADSLVFHNGNKGCVGKAKVLSQGD